MEHRGSASSMNAPMSERAKETPATRLQVYSRHSKRKKLATQLVQPNAEGNPLEYHPCNVEQLTSMPDKRILELILDILQRRDTHEIFAQPVDANEVEGYYEIIKEPMDFGTMRAKLHEGMYSGLEQFECDVFLISRNAMQFNSSSTIYFRQARAIHELAKRVFHTLKTDPEVFGPKISQTRRRKTRKVKTGARVSSSNCPKSSYVCAGESSKRMLRSMGKADKACHPVATNLSGSCIYGVFAGDRHGESESNTKGERRSTYTRQRSSLNEGETAVSKRVDLTDMGYKESLMLFSKSLGPTAQRIAADKLQFASSFIPTLPNAADVTPFEPASYLFDCLAGNAPVTDVNCSTLCRFEDQDNGSSIGISRDETCLNGVRFFPFDLQGPEIFRHGWVWGCSEHVNQNKTG